jgi:two-component system response regulator HydG
MLAMHFLQANAKKAGKTISGFTDAATRSLIAWSWPGNVRELENVVERAVVLARGREIDVAQLPETLFDSAVPAGEVAQPVSYKEARERSTNDFERGYVAGLLRLTNGNMAEAARVAGLDRSNFRKVVVRSGVDYRDFLPRRISSSLAA